MTVPDRPKLYHIVHHDRLPSILNSNGLICDSIMANQHGLGTTVGMSTIKRRRLEELTLDSHPGLYVGECVPFYFCPRSIMLFVLHKANHAELTYRGGQDPIIHLEADLHRAVAWANDNNKRWAFTLSNAGACFFEDRADISQLNEVNWDAVNTLKWAGPGVGTSIKEGKQAEFLIEECFPWQLVERIGVRTRNIYQQVVNYMPANGHRPIVEIKPDWYY